MVASGVLTDKQLANLEAAYNEWANMVEKANEYYVYMSEQETKIAEERKRAAEEWAKIKSDQSDREWETWNIEMDHLDAATAERAKQLQIVNSMNDAMIEQLDYERQLKRLKQRSGPFGGLVDDNTAALIEADQAWVDIMQHMKDTAKELIEGGVGVAFQQTADIIANSIAGIENTKGAFAAAMAQMAAQAILAIGQQAMIKAVFSFAEGVYATAIGDLPQAAVFFKAAALYGAVAGTALAVGGALMSASKSASGAGGSNAGGSYGGAGKKRREKGYEEGGAQTITVNIYGHYVDSKKFTRDEILPGLGDELAKSGGGKKKNKVVTKYG